MNIEAEASAAVDAVKAEARRIGHHGRNMHHQAQQPAVPAFTPAAQAATPTQEGPSVSIRDDIMHMLTVADDDAIHAVNIVLSHPEGITVLSDVAAVAGLNVPPGTITNAVTGLKAVLGLFGQQLAQQQPQQPQQPAPPADGSSPQPVQAAQSAVPQAVRR